MLSFLSVVFFGYLKEQKNLNVPKFGNKFNQIQVLKNSWLYETIQTRWLVNII